MKNRSHKKGFTLVELLAVIVVLALIMVFAVPSILTTMNSAKKKSFQMYGEKVLNSAMQLYESQKLLGEVTAKKYNSNPCYTFDELGITDTGAYQGFIVVIPSNLVTAGGLNQTEYQLYMTDNTYAYNGVPYSSVLGDVSSIKIDSTTITSVTSLLTACK